ncbi:MAG: RNA-binding protein [Lachnospiraceae bacterium]|nr:RNA-binding protein [Lachnospiraceae bacterium]
MVGMLATSLMGHDKGKIYVIVEETKDAVMLADGKLRPVGKPKKKKKKHIQLIKKVVLENQQLENDLSIQKALKEYRRRQDVQI